MTTTERRLAITPGDWQADGYSVMSEQGEVVSTDEQDLTTLIADAGTTYNACDMLPSELLAKYQEAGRLLRQASDWMHMKRKSIPIDAIDTFLAVSNLPK